MLLGTCKFSLWHWVALSQDSCVQSLSNLSPYFHFGQLSVQRVALEIGKHKKTAPAAVDTFLEEAVVRRELSDNFCFYEPNYDNIECAAVWARDTLKLHEKDKREYVYSRYEPSIGCI